MKKIILLVTIACLFSLTATAQRRYSARYNYTTVGFNVGTFNYMGDLNPKTTKTSIALDRTSWGIGADITFKVAQNIRLRSILYYGRIKGDDRSAADPNDDKAIFRYARNLHFRNALIELGEHIIYDFRPGKGRFYRRAMVVPYIFTGISVVYSNPKARTPEDLGNKWVALRPLHTENQKYGPFTIAIPMGGGVRFKVSDRLDVALEASMRYTFSDHLDDVSGNYANIDELGSDLAKRMYNRTAELTSRFNNKERDMARVTAVLGGISNENGYNRLTGMGMAGDTRGLSKDKDVFLSVNVHVNYVIGIQRYRPRSRK
jgi:hypothetical protein